MFSGFVARLARWSWVGSPLRGWFCGYNFLRGGLLCGLWRGLGFDLNGGFCRGCADVNVRATRTCVADRNVRATYCGSGLFGGGARATWAQGWAYFGVLHQILFGIVGDFADHALLFGFAVGVEADVFCVPGGDAQGLDDQPLA
ncbi:MAG: hypothetical protein WB711_16835 [Terriglobales bacterium]